MTRFNRVRGGIMYNSAMEEELDITKLKYVLYARKSTDDPQRQVRSIEDQISECQQLARRLGIKIVDTIEEKKSAKKPHQRPLFTQMLKDIRNGKYDGIIAWNPDRLARNMKEGGEVIDMIDDDFIKDMKFVTHHFSKDANGKMLLGMAFVLSKQYSDNLSQNVTRGVRKNFEEGKTPIPKHGYTRDDDGLYRPDAEKFTLVCEAWQMRREGKSLEMITEYLNDNGYYKETKTGRKIKMTKQILTDVFKDPFYYGILLQANQEVDLREIYNFQPTITEEEYIEVQRLLKSRKLPYKQKKQAAYYPLKMMIVCSFCNNHMYAGASKSSTGDKYLYYRCDTDYCTRTKKSIRGKVIFDFIYDFLKEGLNFTKKEYQQYLESMTSLTSTKREKLQREIHSLQAQLKATTREKEDIAYKVLGFEKESPVRIINEKKVSGLQDEEETLERKIAELKGQLGDPQKETLSLEDFLNLSKNAGIKVKSANVIIKDIICRKIFLNLTIDEEKVLSYQTKEPFTTLIKQRDKSSSRGERT